MSTVIEAGTEIARSPQDVFDYVADGARLPDWQSSVVEAAADRPGLLQVGMSIDGPVRAPVTVALAPAYGGTHVDYGIWFEGHGIGKLACSPSRAHAKRFPPAWCC